MTDDNQNDHKAAAELFAEWFEDNIKTDNITDQFFTTETEAEDN
ncbi:hypothetical protein SAMN04489752_1482 [Brevibacterium siliguriense]|uniref:Uncharacterized protein n=1 Tax=Brevibacterium siliguriense TaxID=1136497 RepID=A0A1H1RCD3_9MICO|nr:hypothetical protein [Brevibacterium siliguriense]SDS33345.1 hypothetical protein SAMN04489752_1482 [Brevibacterium siliguriense]